jgi:hypothetical protein
VLTMWAEGAVTDLDALRIYFDTNQDGIFDAEDAHWYSFGVWQDLNSDGLMDAGEFETLDYYGIVGFELFYTDDSEAYLTADGGVEVFGQIRVLYDDGSHGLAEDMAFIQTLLSEDESNVDAAEAELAALGNVDGEAVEADGELFSITSDEESDPEETAITDLVADYLEIINSQGTDSQDDYVEAELAYALDALVSDYIESNEISIDEYSSIQEDVLNAIDNDYGSDFDNDASIDSAIDNDLSALTQLEVDLPDAIDMSDIPSSTDYNDSGLT